MEENSPILTKQDIKAVLSAYEETSVSHTVDAPTRDRSKSREGMKKMGGGKKGLWGKPEDLITVPALDSGDPNFDSESEDNVILVPAPQDKSKFRSVEVTDGPTPKLPLAEAKKAMTDILGEYFVSGDMEEVRRSILELGCEVFHYEVVKRAVGMSMDKHEKEREMVSRLLSELYPDVLTMAQIGKGFERLLEYVDDLELDAPNARPVLSTFLARAVVDEILPPCFLTDRLICQLGGDIVEQAKKKLSIKHATARLEKGWGPGDGRPVEELKVAIDQLMQEYLMSGELGEAARCVQELHVEHFHHEVVKRGITASLEKGEEGCEKMSALFEYLIVQQVVSGKQLLLGFDRVKEILPDLKLDVPAAAGLVHKMIDTAVGTKLLPADYSNVPSS